MPSHRSREVSLVRAIGIWGLAAGIVNITIGGGIFRLPAAAAGTLGGSAYLAYVVCAAAMGLIVLCFAEAGSRVPVTGGVYAYVEVAFGPLAGFLVGVLLWVGSTLALAAVSSFFVDSLGALVPITALALGRTSILSVAIAMLTALNVRGVGIANRFNIVVTAAKLVPLLMLVIGGIWFVHARNFDWRPFPGVPAVGRTAAVVIFAFLGIETALVPSGEVRNAAHTLPPAVLLAMGTITVLYLAVQVVAQGILGNALPGETAPLAEAAGVALGGWARVLLLVGSTVSIFGYLGGMMLAVPRALFALARDGFLPARLASIHHRFQTPHWAIITQAAIVLFLALSGGFERLAILANGTVLLVYAGSVIALWQLRRKGVQVPGVAPFRMPLAPVVPPLALAVVIWMLLSLTKREWLAIAAVVVVAATYYPIAAVVRRRPVSIHV